MPAPTGHGWESAVLSEPGVLFSPLGVVGSQNGFVAFGNGAVLNGDQRSAFAVVLWYSADGHDWAPIETTSERLAGTALAAAASDGLFVVMGTMGACLPHLGCSAPDGIGIASWTSIDGTAWDYHPNVLGADTYIYQLASDGNSFLAVGKRYLPGGQAPMAWFSSDGSNWAEIVGPDTDQLIAVAGARKGFLVLGERRGPDGTELSFATLDVGTRTWLDEAVMQGPLCCGPRAVALGDRAAVAVGTEGQRGTLAGAGWFRPAGDDAWRRTTDWPELEKARPTMAIAVDSGCFVATGTVGANEANRIAIWSSANGATWTQPTYLSDEAEWAPAGLTARSDGLLVLASLDSGEASDAPTQSWFVPANAWTCLG